MRYKLAAENKAAKYLRYAIGEILLVVIGILIALQVNNWNNERIRINKEIIYLKEIESTLEFNLENEIKGAIEYTNYQIKAYESFRQAVMNYPSGISEDSIDVLLGKWLIYWRLDINSVAFDNLKSVGIDLISSNKLRREITQFYGYDLLASVQFNKEHIDWAYANLYPIITNNLNGKELPVSPENIQFLKTDQRTKNIFDTNCEFFMKGTIEWLEDLQPKAEILLEHLRTEIEHLENQ